MADRLWMTDDAVLSVTAGQTYLVTGYTKSATGSINLRGFLHASGNKNTVYSDRIAETYASASGRTFSFYMTIKTTAADAQFSLETSNQGTAYEIDSISLRRMNAVIKNNTANEVLIFSNTGAVAYNQGCPG
jgi:autotransporter translocation and assembly factor TamB